MVKTITIHLDEKEFDKWDKKKAKRTWKECLLAGVNSKYELGEI